jgi:hypothetical protein
VLTNAIISKKIVRGRNFSLAISCGLGLLLLKCIDGWVECIIDFDSEESLNDEDEHDSAGGTESSIWQYAAQPSLDSVGGCG